MTAPFLILGFAALWAAIELFGGRVFASLPVAEIVWMRYGWHLLFMALLLGRREGMGLVRTHRPLLQIFRSLMMLVMPLSFALALSRLGDSGVLSAFWCAPLLVLFLAPFSGDTVKGSSWVWCALGWLGAMFIYGASAAAAGAGGVFALGMAGSFAMYVVLTRVLERTEALTTNLFHSALTVFVVLTLTLPFYWQRPSPAAIAGGAVIGVVGAVTLGLLDLALRRGSATDLAPLLYAQPVFVEASRALLNHHMPTRSTTAGGLLIVGVLAVSVLMPRYSPSAS